MTKPSTPQLRVLIAAVRNGGRLPSNTCAYAGYFAPYAVTEKIQEVLAKAAKSRRRAQAEMILATELTRLQLLMAGGVLGVERSSYEGVGTLAERYATAIHSGHGRIDRVTANSVKACIRHGWLTDRWEITTDGRDAAQAAHPESYAQDMPDDQPTTDQDDDAHGSDVPPYFPRARQRFASNSGTDLPDDLVQYDVPLDQAENFVGYQIRVGTDLETLAGVVPKRGGKALALYIPDGWGGTKCVGTVYDTDFPVFGPAGGPDLRHVAARYQSPAPAVTFVIEEGTETFGTGKDGAANELVNGTLRQDWDAMTLSEVHRRLAQAAELIAYRKSVHHKLLPTQSADPVALQNPSAQAAVVAAMHAVTMRPAHDRWPTLSYAGETGSGKTYPHYADPVNVAAAMTGHRAADLTSAERAALAEGIPPTVRDRLMPAVNPDLVDELRPRYWYLRDGIAAELAGMGTAEGLAAHRLTDQDPCAEGYRLAVHRARTMPGLPERVRQALFHFQVSLTSAAHGHRGIALTAIDKATAKLGIPSYAEAV